MEEGKVESPFCLKLTVLCRANEDVHVTRRSRSNCIGDSQYTSRIVYRVQRMLSRLYNIRRDRLAVRPTQCKVPMHAARRSGKC